MTTKQKDYIEQNIDLIQDNRWKEFFDEAPAGIGDVIYNADIDFMSALQEVPLHAFYKCVKLTSIIIPDNVQIIRWGAFDGCIELKSVELPNSVKIIEGFAFYNCPSITSITISDNVNTIEKCAFAFCKSITTIALPNSITNIDEGVFLRCDSLTKIDFKGTTTQFKSIKKHENWIDHSITVRCIDGDLVYKP